MHMKWRRTSGGTLLRDLSDAETQDVKSYEQKHKAIYSKRFFLLLYQQSVFHPQMYYLLSLTFFESCVTKLRTVVLCMSSVYLLLDESSSFFIDSLRYVGFICS